MGLAETDLVKKGAIWRQIGRLVKQYAACYEHVMI